MIKRNYCKSFIVSDTNLLFPTYRMLENFIFYLGIVVLIVLLVQIKKSTQ